MSSVNSPPPTTTGGAITVQNSAQGIFDQMAGISREIAELALEAKDLRDDFAREKAAKLAAKPQRPSDDDEDVQAQFEADLAKWQGEYNQMLTDFQGQIDTLMGKIDAADNKLKDLEMSDLPAAQANDCKAMHEQLDGLRRECEALGKAMNPGQDDQVSSAKKKSNGYVPAPGGSGILPPGEPTGA